MRKISIQYTEYLKGKDWKILRRKAYLRANHKCEFCSKPAAHVHHIKYPKNLKDDKLENLVVVCEKCHSLNHGIRKKLNIYLAGKVSSNKSSLKWKAIKKIENVANFYSSDGNNHSEHLWGWAYYQEFDDSTIRDQVAQDIIRVTSTTDLLVAVLGEKLSCGSIAEIAWFAAKGIPCQIYLLNSSNKAHDWYWLVSHFPRVKTKIVNKKELVEDLLKLISKISNEENSEV